MSDSVYTYVKREAEMSLLAPPDTDFQRGYLAATLVIAENLGLRMDMPPFAEADRLCQSPIATMSRRQHEIIRCLRKVEELVGEKS